MIDNNKKYKIYTESNEILDKIKDSNIDDVVLEFETFAYNIAFEELTRGVIVEKEVIYDLLDFYLRVENTNRSKTIADILNKYYDGFLSEKFKELISDEKYEICEKLKNLI